MIETAYHRLFELYGEQHWWPSRSGTRWEIVAGAVLTQNCAWRNVEKVLEQLDASGLNTPGKILNANMAVLREAIRSAGFFNQKSVYLRETAKFFIENETEYLKQCSTDELWKRRKRLLAVKGVGCETADSILLYAFDQPLFVIDAYTRRMAARHLGLDSKIPYDRLQKIFMDNLLSDVQLYKEYHALIVKLCKESCLKKACGDICHRIFREV